MSINRMNSGLEVISRERVSMRVAAENKRWVGVSPLSSGWTGKSKTSTLADTGSVGFDVPWVLDWNMRGE